MSIAALKSLARGIREAREGKGLSQRALAERVGIPQGHISRIENGDVDLQASSLIQLARALDLELALIPRNVLPTLQALRKTPTETTPAALNIRLSLNRLRYQAARLVQKFPQAGELTRLVRTLLELRGLPLALPDKQTHELAVAMERLARVLRELRSQRGSVAPDRTLLSEAASLERVLRNFRNAVMHGANEPTSAQTPAYTLDDEEDDDA